MAGPSDRDANRGLHDRLNEIYGRYTRLRSDMDVLQQRLAALRVSATSPDNLVRATVGPRGQLVDLRIDRRRAPTVDTDRLARIILDTVTEAARRSANEVEALMTEYLPADASALRFLRDNDFATMMGRSDAGIDHSNAEDDRPYTGAGQPDAGIGRPDGEGGRQAFDDNPSPPTPSPPTPSPPTPSPRRPRTRRDT